MLSLEKADSSRHLLPSYYPVAPLSEDAVGIDDPISEYRNERMNHQQAFSLRARISRWLTLFAVIFVALPVVAEDGAQLLRRSGVAGGLVVHLGCGDGAVTAQLSGDTQFMVQGLDTDADKVASARGRLLATGQYGRVSVDQWDGKALPYSDNLVNLIVAEEPESVDEAEMLRALAPLGVALVKRGGKWSTISKPWPKEIDEWSHYLHGPDGNPVANDTVVGPPDRMQWVGGPRWARHHDHMASLTSMVSAGGRLFYIFDEGPTASIQLPSSWKLIARDAFNGTILWKRDIPQWNTRQYPLKSGPAHLLRRLVSDGARVYVTLGLDAPLTALDSATGETKTTFEKSAFTREILVSSGVTFSVADSAASRLPEWRREDSYVWLNTRRANVDWGWAGSARKLQAHHAKTGRLLWSVEYPVAPCSLAVDATRAVFHDGERLICLDRTTGDPIWKGEPIATAMPVQTNTGPRIVLYGDVVLFASGSVMSGWSAKDGKKLWGAKYQPTGHQSLKDLMVVQGLVWNAAIAGSSSDGVFAGYDPVTGEMKREFPPNNGVHWFHHRCYPSKATNNFILTARQGTEFVDLANENWEPHSWVRGGCIYGVMPANGLTYAPMSACGCQLEAKLTGLNALASGLPAMPSAKQLSGTTRLTKGPAYGKSTLASTSAKRAEALAEAWPTYRHDQARSGASSTKVSPSLKEAWQTKLGGRLSAPTIAAGKLFVASIDTHTVHALDLKSGKPAWSYTTGGRIDSPPTYHKGLAIFGSADGYVYALRARDGELAWRFRGAPMDRRVMAWEQVESAWPVHGSVLVREGVVYCTAGRNMFLDGGVRLIRLDAMTGALIGETVMDETDPVDGGDMQLTYLKKVQGNNMPVAHTDVLSCDGKNIWMRSQKIDFEGKRSEIAVVDVKEQPSEDFHLFCQNGFLDDSYFFRSYWTYGRRVSGGYSAWLKAGRLVPSGRILCFDDDRVYGYGRKPEYMVNSSVIEYQIFSTDKNVSPEALEHLAKAERAINSRSKQKNPNGSDWLLRSFFPREDLTAARAHWVLDQPTVLARAMVATRDLLFAAGPLDTIDEREAFREPDNPDVKAKLVHQAEALEGKHGGQLWAVSKADGQPVARYSLDTIPAFDAMAAADGRLFMCSVDGRVICLGADGRKSLDSLDGAPIRVAYDKPEDPAYLLEPEVLLNKDFSKVMGCKVVECDLGYRVKSLAKGRISAALKKLDKPMNGAATFTTTMLPTPGASGVGQNGYLALGDGIMEQRLIKCGIRFRNQRAFLIQSPLAKYTGMGPKVEAPVKAGAEIVVAVDIKAQTITLTVNGVSQTQPLARPMKAITQIGYVVDNSWMDFTPIDIERH